MTQPTSVVSESATDFLVACPIRDCDERLAAEGLTERHLLLHVADGGIDRLIPALVVTWHAHARLLRIAAARPAHISTPRFDGTAAHVAWNAVEATREGPVMTATATSFESQEDFVRRRDAIRRVKEDAESLGFSLKRARTGEGEDANPAEIAELKAALNAPDSDDAVRDFLREHHAATWSEVAAGDEALFVAVLVHVLSQD